jgi:N-methylhydantoinase B/oxoprolinase/acetone carboxylase alpha subunit
VLLNGLAFDTRRQQRLKRGDVLTLRTPGGGGYGPPG